MLQFSRIKKMCFFKRETFCIIQRKNEISMVKRSFFFSFIPCRNSARYDIQFCRNYSRSDGSSVQKFCASWRPVWCLMMQKFCTPWHPLSAAEILQAMTSCVVEILCVARFSVREILNRCFSILRKDIVEGPRIPTVSINFLFMLFLFISDHSWNNGIVHADVFCMTG